jgi:cobalt-zinc-cadmium efflux system outer membrane protein
MRTTSATAAALAVAVLPIRAETFQKVQTEVRDRSGADIRWEKQMAARQETAAVVAKLLRKPLTVASAVQIALLSNRGLQATFVTVPNPSVDFDVQFPVVAAQMNRYGWLVAQEFVQILMIPLKKKIAEERLEAAELRVAAETLRLVAEVKAAYFTYQGEQQLLTRLKIIQETNAAALDLAQKQFEAGNITDFALLQSQSSYSQGRLDLAKAETDLRSQREKLNRLLGLWGEDTDWEIKGDIMPTADSDFTTKRLESLAVAVLNMGFTGERDTDGALNMGPSFSIEFPIFNQGQSRIARGEAQLRMAESTLEALAVDIRSGVRELRDRLLSLADMARFYHDDLLPTRIRMMNNAILEYNAMQFSPYELFLAKSQELEAERGYIDTLRDYWITRAELERAVGGTLTPRKRETSLSER